MCNFILWTLSDENILEYILISQIVFDRKKVIFIENYLVFICIML